MKFNLYKFKIFKVTKIHEFLGTLNCPRILKQN